MAAIVAGDILFKYSTTAGAAGNTNTETSSGHTGSIGKYVSTSAWAGGALNDLFDDVSGAENAASTVDYRCIFVHNNNGANAFENVSLYLSAETAGGASIAIAVDTTAASALGSASAQALQATSETVPGASVSGLSFSSPTTSGTGLSMGNIPVGYVKAFWVRRTAANTAALSADGVTIAVTGDTGSL